MMLTALLLAMCLGTPPGDEFVVTVTYYEAEAQAKNHEGQSMREFRQHMGHRKRDVVCSASQMSYGWVPKADNRRKKDVSELVHTSVKAIGSNSGAVRLTGHVQYWEDTKTTHTKKLDGEYSYGAPIIIPLSPPHSEKRVWAVVLVTKPPVVRVDD
jgi:hypothetical protein